MHELIDRGTLSELALDLRWSWDHAADDLWRAMDPDLWEATSNPWIVLDATAPKRIAALLEDPDFAQRAARIVAEKRKHEEAPSWFSKIYVDVKLKEVAYFSMEFMLTEALPIYSGGLGNVAGDQLKAASDLGVPVVGIGLLFSQGYFRQCIRDDGSQEPLYPTNDTRSLPLQPLRDTKGDWVRLRYDLAGRPLWTRAWEVQVGGKVLYLLDTNDPANHPAYRCITSELYGGAPELRLQQEIVLGILGWQLLGRLGRNPEVCHLNEGHASFAALERIACFRAENDCSFAEALAATRAGNVFTTHTAVEAGFDRFEPALMRRYFSRYAEERLGITVEELLALGRCDPGNQGEPFNMAYLAIRVSGSVSAVSTLHEQVSKRLFEPLFPHWPLADIPVRHVTNGIHVPSWISINANQIWTDTLGEDPWRGNLHGVETRLGSISLTRLWASRSGARRDLIAFVRSKHARQRAEIGAAAEEIASAETVFDSGVLTLGFARRFATYKRPDLLLHDPDRLARILLDRERPVQLVVAGKAHPADVGGHALVKRWAEFARRPDMRKRVVFLADYDMRIAQHLVQGVDVWVNTPRRPWEASGTSGMKLLANGGLNLSELDGWWAEAYAPNLGWAFGDPRPGDDDPAVDDAEAEMLYALLEKEIVPEFYDRGADGIPLQWVSRIRDSMARLAPRFSANRAVREYTEILYLPAAAEFVARSANRGEKAREMVRWLERMGTMWPQIRFGEMRKRTAGGVCHVSVDIFLGDVPPASIAVELYADPNEAGGDPFRVPMQPPIDRSAPAYTVAFEEESVGRIYTARVMPRHPQWRVPLETPLILWQQ